MKIATCLSWSLLLVLSAAGQTGFQQPGKRVTVNVKKAGAAGFTTLSFDQLSEGVYEFYSTATLTEKVVDKTVNTYRMQWQWNANRVTGRIVYDNYAGGNQYIGRFDLTEKEKTLKIWLPKGVTLSSVTYKKYEAPALPAAMAAYTPLVTPPTAHP
ncbi:MAG TPA: hypothetical protein VGE79_01700, partial [Niastella sp.]